MPPTETTETDSSAGPPTNKELAEQLNRLLKVTAQLAETQRDLTERLNEHDTPESPPAANLSDADPSLDSTPDYFR
jgi:hypothetical protein